MITLNPDTQFKLDNIEGLVSTRSENDETFRELCLRFLAQCCFENNSCVSEMIIKDLYNQISKIAFLP